MSRVLVPVTLIKKLLDFIENIPTELKNILEENEISNVIREFRELTEINNVPESIPLESTNTSATPPPKKLRATTSFAAPSDTESYTPSTESGSDHIPAPLDLEEIESQSTENASVRSVENPPEITHRRRRRVQQKISSTQVS